MFLSPRLLRLRKCRRPIDPKPAIRKIISPTQSLLVTPGNQEISRGFLEKLLVRPGEKLLPGAVPALFQGGGQVGGFLILPVRVRILGHFLVDARLQGLGVYSKEGPRLG